MSSILGNIGPALVSIVVLIRAGVTSLTSHWTLSFFSVAVAFGIWFVVQDVENPRVEDVVPFEDEAGIPVEILNEPDGVVVLEVQPVRVRVEAREEEIMDLRAGDFKATLDAQGIEPGSNEPRTIRVTSLKGGIRVVSVLPQTVEVQAVAAVAREFPVTPRFSGELPAGFEREGLLEIDPPFVTVSGIEELVDTVSAVEVDLNLAGIRDTATFDLPIVARTRTGGTVTVELSENRARVTIDVVPKFAEREVRVIADIAGEVAPGYRLVDLTIDPPLVTISGTPNVVDGIEFLTVGQLDISGAKSNVTEPREIVLPPNISSEVGTAIVTVTVEPIVCGTDELEGCIPVTRVVAPTFEDIPAGLQVAPGSYNLEVRLSGPLEIIASLELEDITATISLEGGEAGAALYDVEVTGPDGISITPPLPLTITLLEPS